jgi:dihydrofolate reductase
MSVRVDLNVSLDGYATTEGGTPDNPFGDDWTKLTAAYAATRTFRERVFHDTSGEGTTGVDDRYAAAYFEGVGAEIMGAGMFGFHTFPDDPNWKGWWGDEPPFRVPVFVLTHRTLDSIDMSGGTTFHFVSATPHEVLAAATNVAEGKDVRVGGGITNCTSPSRPSCSVAASTCGASFAGSRTATRCKPRPPRAARCTSRLLAPCRLVSRRVWGPLPPKSSDLDTLCGGRWVAGVGCSRWLDE